MQGDIRVAQRQGFTLIEMLMSVGLTVMLFGLAVPFFGTQLRSVGANGGRWEALQNVRYAATTLDRDLRVAGVGVVDRQPLIVQAAPYAITFNADLVTRDTADPVAVYYNPDAPPS